MPPERQFGVDPVFRGGQAQLRQPPGLGSCPGLIGHLGVRRSPPQRQCLGQYPRGPLGLTCGQRLPALGRQRLETPRVGLLDVQYIARGAGDQHVARTHLAERPPQARKIHVKALRPARRRISGPQFLDQPVPRDDLVGVHEQERQQGPLAPAAHRHTALVRIRLERPQDTEPHPHPNLGRRLDARTVASFLQGAVNCPAAVSPHVQVASDIRNGGGRRDGSDGRLWLASKSSRPNV